MHTLRILLVIGGLALAACGGDDDGGEIAETPLAGKVGGKAWTFARGETNAFLSEDDPDFFAELYDKTFATCSREAPTGGDHVILAVPKQVGDYGLSLARNMTFVVGDDNIIGTSGRIVVDEVTATTVRGGIHVRYDDANEIDGQFTIAICPDDPF